MNFLEEHKKLSNNVQRTCCMLLIHLTQFELSCSWSLVLIYFSQIVFKENNCWSIVSYDDYFSSMEQTWKMNIKLGIFNNPMSLILLINLCYVWRNWMSKGLEPWSARWPCWGKCHQGLCWGGMVWWDARKRCFQVNVICIVVLMVHNSVACIDLFCFLEIVT